MNFFPKKLTYPATLIVLFAGSVWGGIIYGYLVQPKEACAQCVALPRVPTCNWSGKKYIHGDQGPEDDICVCCQGNTIQWVEMPNSFCSTTTTC